jgi:hypothetical protein
MNALRFFCVFNLAFFVTAATAAEHTVSEKQKSDAGKRDKRLANVLKLIDDADEINFTPKIAGRVIPNPFLKTVTFFDLVNRNASLLRSLVRQELDGRFSSGLAYAENILHNTSDEDARSFSDDLQDLEFMHVIRNKSKLCRSWIVAIDESTPEEYLLPEKAINHNAHYVANSYFYDRRYDGHLTLLSYALRQANERIFRDNTAEKYDNLYLSIMRFLLKAGANPNAIDEHEDRPLVHNAATVDQMKLLYESGADINKQDKQGETLLVKCMRTIRLGYGSSYTHALVEYLQSIGAQ